MTTTRLFSRACTGVMLMVQPRCKDCRAEGVTTNRKAPYPGPRCATHHRAQRKKKTRRSHGEHIEKTYGITSDEYEAIYKYQGGRCYICQRATGAKRRLAVDHDHETGYVRGLLCRTCNYKILGHLRDDPSALERAVAYLKRPPAFRVLGKRRVPGE